VRLLDRRRNRRLSAAYRRVFAAPEATAVLGDLGDFCRARSAPFVAGDAMATGVLIGRQEVFHRIARYLNLEVWMVGGMAAIIGLLTKLAFWPA
jgi:hypothetical protein